MTAGLCAFEAARSADPEVRKGLRAAQHRQRHDGGETVHKIDADEVGSPCDDRPRCSKIPVSGVSRDVSRSGQSKKSSIISMPKGRSCGILLATKKELGGA